MRSEDAAPGTLLAVRHGAVPGRLTLVLRAEEGTVSYTVAETFYTDLGAPAAGYHLSAEELERLLAHVAARRALASALGSLARGDESRRNLYLKLRRKGHSDDAARAALDEVERLGYLREADSAVCRQRLEPPQNARIPPPPRLPERGGHPRHRRGSRRR